MNNLRVKVEELVNQPMARCGFISMAAISGTSPEPVVSWAQADVEDEPGYLIYSITKTFVSTLFLQLQDEGRISLDDPLAHWFPNIVRSEKILIRQLLNHTAGIPDYGELRSYHDAVRASPSMPWTFERYAAETFEKGLGFEPGTNWAYSNPGYMLLRGIVENVGDATFAQLISDRIAEPLGLQRTYVAESLADLASLAPCESQALAPDGNPRDVRDCYHPGWVSHGVMASTPSEIVRFFDALFRGQLVSLESLQQMKALVPVPGKWPPWVKPSYGLGLTGDPESPWGPVWGHGGEGPGYRTSVIYAPELGNLSLCAMCSTETARAEGLIFQTLDALRE